MSKTKVKTKSKAKKAKVLTNDEIVTAQGWVNDKIDPKKIAKHFNVSVENLQRQIKST